MVIHTNSIVIKLLLFKLGKLISTESCQKLPVPRMLRLLTFRILNLLWTYYLIPHLSKFIFKEWVSSSYTNFLKTKDVRRWLLNLSKDSLHSVLWIKHWVALKQVSCISDKDSIWQNVIRHNFKLASCMVINLAKGMHFPWHSME